MSLEGREFSMEGATIIASAIASVVSVVGLFIAIRADRRAKRAERRDEKEKGPDLGVELTHLRTKTGPGDPVAVWVTMRVVNRSRLRDGLEWIEFRWNDRRARFGPTNDPNIPALNTRVVHFAGECHFVDAPETVLAVKTLRLPEPKLIVMSEVGNS